MEDQESGNTKPEHRAWKRVKREINPAKALPHHLVENILEKLPVEYLVRLKYVSKEWHLTIMSKHFQERHFISSSQRSQEDPNILFVQSRRVKWNPPTEVCLNILTIKSLRYDKRSHLIFNDISLINVTKSCDGLLCIYDFVQGIYVINPSLKWCRSLPVASLQKHFLEKNIRAVDNTFEAFPMLGLGKDNVNGAYKLVWLYNSKCMGLDTTCEVFSFETNTWREVTASPYRVAYGEDPTYLDGSLHWLSDVFESKRYIVSFHLHTETFQVNMKTPINIVDHVAISNLNDHLCISERKGKKLVIWSLHSENIWEKRYTIDLRTTSYWFECKTKYPARAITTTKDNKILLHSWKIYGDTILMHDTEKNSYDVIFFSKHRGFSVPYYPSLLTV